jgi:hypothetical protein
MGILDVAHQYVDMGYTIIPEVAKRPVIKWRKYQSEHVTHEQVNQWWGRHPEYGIGVVTGSAHGLVILDADTEEMVRLVELHCAPTPFRIRTRRGMHFYFHLTHHGIGIRHLSTEPSGLHVDILGDGGKATGLGTTHESGHVYILDQDADMFPVADLPAYEPDWFPRPMRAPRTMPKLSLHDGTAMERASRYLDKIDGMGSGGRNVHTYKVAASVVRDFGLTEEQGIFLMSPWNEAHNDPPLPQRELIDIVHSVTTRGKYDYGRRMEVRPD